MNRRFKFYIIDTLEYKEKIIYKIKSTKRPASNLLKIKPVKKRENFELVKMKLKLVYYKLNNMCL